MISVLSFKPFQRGMLLGFFTMRYHGLSIQNCRLMAGKDGGAAWFAFPQIKTEQDGETKYLDIMQLTNAEREHVRALILADLQQQGHLQGQQSNQGHQKATRPPQGNGTRRHVSPEGENLSEHYTDGVQDDIPF